MPLGVGVVRKKSYLCGERTLTYAFNNTNMTGIGIIGCGKIAQVRHIPELHANPEARIVGFYNPTLSRAEAMAACYGGKVYGSIDEMLADPDIEAVVVSLANQAHASVSIQALEAGKAVLCEKPMATTIQECEAMVQASRKANLPLMIAQNQRLTAAHQQARRMIEAGSIGRLLTFRTTFGHGGPETWSVNPGKGTWFFSKDKAAMGVMADLGIHKTDLIQYLTGQHVTAVKATIATLHKTQDNGQPIEVDDNAIVIYTLSGGAIGTMTASWTHYGAEDNSTVLYGTEGILRIYDNPAYAIELIHADGSREQFDVERIQTNDNQTSSGMSDLFVKAVREGAGSQCYLSAESVLPAMRAIFAAIESGRTGAEVIVAGE